MKMGADFVMNDRERYLVYFLNKVVSTNISLVIYICLISGQRAKGSERIAI